MTKKELRKIREHFSDDSEVKKLFEYVDSLRLHLGRALEFISRDYDNAKIEDSRLSEARDVVEKACLLLGVQGEKIRLNFGPKMKQLF